ncbi:MAG: DUF2029 domain-containing protein [Proteobacteria bacterium]|nr:DUF2029 domain-containing protein [Pseudomonadota bacterium]
MAQAQDGPSPAADGHWLTVSRLTVYPRIFLTVFILSASSWMLLSQDMLDPQGKPIGYDFLTFWSASKLALGGDPAAAFDMQKLFEVEQATVPGIDKPFLWHYPPTFQLVTLPLALVPYIFSYLIWASLTLLAFVLVVRKLAPSPRTLWVTLAFPGTYINFLQGQNGFLTAALFGGAVLYLDKRPVLAGIMFGLLSYKPHMGLLIPLALICGRQWTAFFSAAITTVLFALVATVTIGTESWVAFWNDIPIVRIIVEQGLLPWTEMPGLYTTLRLIGSPSAFAYGAQLVLALGVAAAVALVWLRKVPTPVAASVLVSGTLLVTPYSFNYDLTLLAVPVALLAWDGYRHGWLRGEREVLVLVWLLPLVMAPIAIVTSLQVGFIGLAAMFAIALRRARAWDQGEVSELKL